MATDPPPPGDERPNAARMYDYWLGGSYNLAVDRETADQVDAAYPGVGMAVRANRPFLRRVVRILADERGIDQFVDLGSGIPTVGNVHEIAQRVNPGARVVYVDVETVASRTAETLLAGVSGVGVLQADLRDPGGVLGDPGLRSLIDLSRPVALLLVSVLHFFESFRDIADVVAAYRRALAPGSYLAISHLGTGRDRADHDPDQASAALASYARSPTPVYPREAEQVRALFGDFELVEPGLVQVYDWRPDGSATPEQIERLRARVAFSGGVGRKG